MSVLDHKITVLTESINELDHMRDALQMQDLQGSASQVERTRMFLVDLLTHIERQIEATNE